MLLFDYHLDYVLVFFIYGLGFFSMGLALLLEIERSPRLGERRQLVPLAAFGLLHGIQEWVEIFLLQGFWLGVPFPSRLYWYRSGLLVMSFLLLLLYASLALSDRYGRRSWVMRLSISLPILLILSLLAIHLSSPELGLYEYVDPLARYFLAVPASLLAGMALTGREQEERKNDRSELAARFQWASIGFAVYGLSQIIVPPVDIFPANWINTVWFNEVMGFPVQIVRAVMAIVITFSLIKAVQWVDQEREQQLLSAQQARLDALEQVRQELIERETMRRELLRHIVVAQEDERARIARELHDETAQILTAFSLNLATLRSAFKKNQPEDQTIGHLQALTRKMSQGLYRLVRDLRPAQLDDLGLVAALQSLAEQECKQAGLQVDLQIEGPTQRIDRLVETVIFRVAQEALTNASRYAGTGEASLFLAFTPEEVILLVEDEGAGFSLQDGHQRGGNWGLAGMRERVESVCGQLEIESVPGIGTKVRVVIPLRVSDPVGCKERIHG